MRTSNSGERLRSSRVTNATSSNAPSTRLPTTSGEPQPRSGPSMTPNRRMPSPATDRSAPATSSRPLVAARRLGDHPQADEHADRHQRDVDEEHRAPPEVVEEQAAHDRPEREPGRAEHRPHPDRAGPLLGWVQPGDDRSAGLTTPAAPTPMSARAPMSASVDGLNAATTHAIPNSAYPVRNTSRRP